jgi:cytochrome P450
MAIMGIAPRVNGTAPPVIPLSEIHLGSLEFWQHGDDVRDGAFATLRREAPISFFPEPSAPGFEEGPGHWAVTRFDDVHYISRHPDLYGSYPNIGLSDVPPEVAEFFGSMIALDDPRHQRLRNIVSRAFTLKVVARIEASVQDRARRLVDSMITAHPDGRGELVADFAGPLPLQVICDMIGIPEEDHQKVFQWANQIVGASDPEIAANIEAFMTAATEFAAYSTALAEERRAEPHDDLTTSLVQAEVDGERLASAEVASFFMLLAVAGNETTRNAISHGVLALTGYPEQREKWWSDFDGLARTAVEEIVRWASPVIYMRRTLRADTELNGVKMASGDKVSLWYNSVNRDESKFANPWAFDVARNPNPHQGFGGGGAHFCLGANLARREISVAFQELRSRMPDIAASEEPTRLASSFVHGIKRLPVVWTLA